MCEFINYKQTYDNFEPRSLIKMHDHMYVCVRKFIRETKRQWRERKSYVERMIVKFQKYSKILTKAIKISYIYYLETKCTYLIKSFLEETA